MKEAWNIKELSSHKITFNKDCINLPKEVLDSKFWEEIKNLSEELLELYDFGLSEIRKAVAQKSVLNEAYLEDELLQEPVGVAKYAIPNYLSTDREDNKIRLKNYSQIEDFAKEFVESTMWEEEGYYKWISDREKVTVIFEGDFDNHVIASILFEASRDSWLSYEEWLTIADEMEWEEKTHIMKLAFAKNESEEACENLLKHSSFMVEYLIDWVTLQELQGFKKSKLLIQWHTSVLWYDYPEYVDLQWMEVFKDRYDKVMTKATLLWKKVAKEDTSLLKYTSALGHLTRVTFEVNPAELISFIKYSHSLNSSLSRLWFETYIQFKELSPLFAKSIKKQAKIDY